MKLRCGCWPTMVVYDFLSYKWCAFWKISDVVHLSVIVNQVLMINYVASSLNLD